jgi:hypothetical protein
LSQDDWTARQKNKDGVIQRFLFTPAEHV